jgi:hypothetical protein
MRMPARRVWFPPQAALTLYRLGSRSKAAGGGTSLMHFSVGLRELVNVNGYSARFGNNTHVGLRAIEDDVTD